MVENCKNCGIKLYALNMSDNDSELCQDCDEKIVDELYKDILETFYSKVCS